MKGWKEIEVKSLSSRRKKIRVKGELDKLEVDNKYIV
jgi:hypothetical protein